MVDLYAGSSKMASGTGWSDW